MIFHWLFESSIFFSQKVFPFLCLLLFLHLHLDNLFKGSLLGGEQLLNFLKFPFRSLKLFLNRLTFMFIILHTFFECFVFGLLFLVCLLNPLNLNNHLFVFFKQSIDIFLKWCFFFNLTHLTVFAHQIPNMLILFFQLFFILHFLVVEFLSVMLSQVVDIFLSFFFFFLHLLPQLEISFPWTIQLIFDFF